MGNIVAIVGRPNVGKSTLFNRLTQTRQAIVHESSGVTRDRHYGKSDWNGHDFSLIDTGGYIRNSDDVFESEIRKQVELAIQECDTILFVVDVEAGVTDLDDAVAGILRQSRKPAMIVANKVDNNERMYDVNEFYSLGLPTIATIFPMICFYSKNVPYLSYPNDFNWLRLFRQSFETLTKSSRWTLLPRKASNSTLDSIPTFFKARPFCPIIMPF